MSLFPNLEAELAAAEKAVADLFARGGKTAGEVIAKAQADWTAFIATANADVAALEKRVSGLLAIGKAAAPEQPEPQVQTGSLVGTAETGQVLVNDTTQAAP